MRKTLGILVLFIIMSSTLVIPTQATKSSKMPIERMKIIANKVSFELLHSDDELVTAIVVYKPKRRDELLNMFQVTSLTR